MLEEIPVEICGQISRIIIAGILVIIVKEFLDESEEKVMKIFLEEYSEEVMEKYSDKFLEFFFERFCGRVFGGISERIF